MATTDSNDRTEMPGMAADRFRIVAHRAVEIVAEYLSTIRTRPVFTPMQAVERERLLRQELPSSELAPGRDSRLGPRRDSHPPDG